MRYLVSLAVLVLVLIEVHTAPAAAQQGETVPLDPGCTNVTLTWPPGTPISIVGVGVVPFGALESVFRYDAAAQRFVGYSPIPNAPNDYLTVGARLETVFICVRVAATLALPAATSAPSTPTIAPPTSGSLNCYTVGILTSCSGPDGVSLTRTTVGISLFCSGSGGYTATCTTVGIFTHCSDNQGRRFTCTRIGEAVRCS